MLDTQEDSLMLKIKDLGEKLKERGNDFLEQRELLKFLMDNAPIGFLTITNGTITYINKTLWCSLGYSVYSEVINKDFSFLLSEEYHSETQKEIECLYEGIALCGYYHKKLLNIYGEEINCKIIYYVGLPLTNKIIHMWIINNQMIEDIANGRFGETSLK